MTDVTMLDSLPVSFARTPPACQGRQGSVDLPQFSPRDSATVLTGVVSRVCACGNVWILGSVRRQGSPSFTSYFRFFPPGAFGLAWASVRS